MNKKNKGVIFRMKNQTKLLSKYAVLLVTVGAGITLASTHHVSVHADTWQNNVKHVGSQSVHSLAETNKKLIQQIQKSQEAKKIKNSLISSNDALDRMTAGHTLANAEREAKLFKAKSKKLFRIRVKAHKLYTYINTKLHKEGRKIEKKGAILWVSSIIKKGHKTFYKLFNGKVIPASKHVIEKLSK